MKQSNTTADTRLQDAANNWFWNDLSWTRRNEIAEKYFPNYGKSLNPTEIETCYLAEHPTKEVQPPTPESKSYEWWFTLSATKAAELRNKYYPSKSLLTKDERNEIYKAEHSTAAAAKEEETVVYTMEERPAISGGMGWFTVNPGLVQFPFWAANKQGSENNTYPWYEDADVNEAKERAKLFVQAVNGYSKLENDLSFAMELANKENKIVEKLEGDNAALVSALKDAMERMERARGILNRDGNSNWGMLDTSDLNKTLNTIEGK